MYLYVLLLLEIIKKIFKNIHKKKQPFQKKEKKNSF